MANKRNIVQLKVGEGLEGELLYADLTTSKQYNNVQVKLTIDEDGEEVTFYGTERVGELLLGAGILKAGVSRKDGPYVGVAEKGVVITILKEKFNDGSRFVIECEGEVLENMESLPADDDDRDSGRGGSRGSSRGRGRGKEKSSSRGGGRSSGKSSGGDIDSNVRIRQIANNYQVAIALARRYAEQAHGNFTKITGGEVLTMTFTDFLNVVKDFFIYLEADPTRPKIDTSDALRTIVDKNTEAPEPESEKAEEGKPKRRSRRSIRKSEKDETEALTPNDPKGIEDFPMEDFPEALNDDDGLSF